jgi:drug/metabolite transporter (DMT)-like permease
MSGFFASLSPTIRGAVWMSVAAMVFAVMIMLVRYLSDSFDALQVVFFRNIFGAVALLPWFFRQGHGVLATKRFGLHVLRAANGLLAMTLWFTTLASMPLAEATALSFTAPAFTSILAVLVLGEVMRIRRWAAIGVAFLGALIILRPGVEALDPFALLAIVTAVVWGFGTVMIKYMSRTESTEAIVAYMPVLLTPISLVPAMMVWQWPDAAQWLAALALGLAASTGHFCLTRALTEADATVVVPVDYLRLPFVALFAYLVFGQTADIWVWLGGGLIAGSAIYIARREATAASS